jgi:hypothetical protein
MSRLTQRRVIHVCTYIGPDLEIAVCAPVTCRRRRVRRCIGERLAKSTFCGTYITVILLCGRRGLMKIEVMQMVASSMDLGMHKGPSCDVS